MPENEELAAAMQAAQQEAKSETSEEVPARQETKTSDVGVSKESAPASETVTAKEVEDIKKATEELKKEFEDFIRKFAEENGLNEGQKINDLFSDVGDRLYKGIEQIEKAAKEHRELVTMDLNSVEQIDRSIGYAISELNRLVTQYEAGHTKMGRPEFEGKMDEFNSRLKSVNESADRQGKERIQNFFSADSEDSAFRNIVYGDLGRARHALDTAKKLRERLQAVLHR